VVFLNFRKTFDSVSHKKLTMKLRTIVDSALGLIYTYDADATQLSSTVATLKVASALSIDVNGPLIRFFWL